MRQTLEHLSDRIDRVDTDNLYQAVNDLKNYMQQIVELLDKALPIDRSDDV